MFTNCCIIGTWGVMDGCGTIRVIRYIINLFEPSSDTGDGPIPEEATRCEWHGCRLMSTMFTVFYSPSHTSSTSPTSKHLSAFHHRSCFSISSSSPSRSLVCSL